MEAASSLLEEVGYEGFTLRKCAAKAGVSPSAPAHHFKDAAGLLSALAVEGFNSLAPRLKAAFLAPRKNGANQCTAVAKEYIAFAKENPALYKVMFGSKLDANDENLTAASESCFKSFYLSVSEIMAGKSEKEIAATSLKAWSSVHGLSMLIIDGRINFLVGKSFYKDLSALESAWANAKDLSAL